MTVAAIVQARLGSSRLPAKVLLPLPTGNRVIEEVIFRCARIEGVDAVVVATPDTVENDIVAYYAGAALGLTWKRAGLAVIRGPEHNVLARYLKAAEIVKADIVMRITADCPLLDPQVCAEVLELQKTSNADYVSNSWPRRTFPHGFDCEVFTMDLLRKRARIADSGRPVIGEIEHVTAGMQQDETIMRALLSADEDRSHLRWTLDTLEDYVRIWNVMEGDHER